MKSKYKYKKGDKITFIVNQFGLNPYPYPTYIVRGIEEYSDYSFYKLTQSESVYTHSFEVEDCEKNSEFLILFYIKQILKKF